MSTLDRHTFPPNGWIFYQPQTGWNAPTPMGSTFDQTVVLIAKHRQANPAAVIKYKLSTDLGTIANELDMYTRMRLGIPLDPPPGSFPQPSRSLPQAAAAAVDGVRKMASGLSLLFEWEKSGQPPVALDIANARAAVCAECPKNDPAHISKFFTQPVSDMIRKQLGRLHSMNLVTFHDEKLGVCSVCVCPLTLKTHTPLDLILKHTKPETMAEFPEHCWIKNNDKQLTEPNK